MNKIATENGKEATKAALKMKSAQYGERTRLELQKEAKEKEDKQKAENATIDKRSKITVRFARMDNKTTDKKK